MKFEKANCSHCGKEYDKKIRYDRPNQKNNFCSKKCASEFQKGNGYKPKTGDYKPCPICGKDVYYQIGQLKNEIEICCSRKCLGIKRSMEFEINPNLNNKYIDGRSYSFRGKHWRKLSQLIKDKYDNKCSICGSEIKPITHHIIPFDLYDNIELANNENNLICICRSCHVSTHNYMKVLKPNVLDDPQEFWLKILNKFNK